MGLLLDETGALDAEKLIWTSKAWTELLGDIGAMGLLGEGREGREAMEIDEVRELQERIAGLRFSFLAGWAVEVERLYVLGVRM